MNWEFIFTLFAQLLTFGILVAVLLQVRSARMERLECLWDSIYQFASKEVEKLGEKEKIESIDSRIERTKLRRNRHLFLERMEEALRIERPKWWDFWDSLLKKRHRRVQEYYWAHLKVYGDDIEAFKEVKIWHDYSSGKLDPLAIGHKILKMLSDEKKKEEEIVEGIVCSVFVDLKMQGYTRKKGKQELKKRLQDLEEFGLVKFKRKGCTKFWELSKNGKEMIGKKSE